jgi:2-C-methyl-D-erythritol 4-phosphate cytidylyltransferase
MGQAYAPPAGGGYHRRVDRVNIALILAGGIGSRMSNDIPKQFLMVDDRPVIIHTMQVFQDHEGIDAILAVCLPEWIDRLWQFADRFGITKLRWVVESGCSGHVSARNGVFFLEGICGDDDIIILHDAVRPMVSDRMVADCLRVCRERGNACAAVRIHETVMITEDGGVSGSSDLDRDTIIRVQTPQAYPFPVLLAGHKLALERGIEDAVYANTMLHDLGERIYFSEGDMLNFKITVEEDLELFRLIMRLP